jgi:hypothetical protein
MTKRDFALLAALYGAWLVCAYLINIAATGARAPADVLHQWVHFDGIYFRAIAEFGYAEASRIIRWQQGFPFLTAAFPLFPLLIHLAASLFAGDYTLASVVVPQTLTFLVLVALFRLVRLDFSRTVAWLSTVSLLTFPTFYFLLAPYSETLFLPFFTLLARDWTSDVFRTNMFNSLFFYFGIGMTVYAWRKLPPVFSLYALLAIVLPALSGSLNSMPRFLLISFPLFVGLGLLCEAHPRLRALLVVLGLGGLLATRLFFQTVFLG